MERNKIILGDAIEVLKGLEKESVDLCFTSPSPYHTLQDGIGGEVEEEDYITNLVDLFDQVHRVLKKTGNLFVQMGDYHINGELPMIPERLVMAMRQDWILRSKLAWIRSEKFEYQEDYARFARDWEYLYFFSKSKDHYFNNPKERILSSVIKCPYKEPNPKHFESGFPEELIKLAIDKCCPEGGIVLDPLGGAGTTGVVVKKMGRQYILIDNVATKVYGMEARLSLP